MKRKKPTSRNQRQILAPTNLPYRMRVLVQSMGREFQTVLEPYGITPLHWGVLSCLWREDGQPIKDVAKQLEQLAGTLTVCLSAMERRQLIHRRQDAVDGRVSRIWLLEKGKRLEFALVPQMRRFVGQLFSCLSEEEYATLAKLTEKLQEHLEQFSVKERQLP